MSPMLIDISEENEKAYYNKYGVSLRERLKHAIKYGDLTDETIDFYKDCFAKSANSCNTTDLSTGLGNLLWLLCGFSDGTYVRHFLEQLPRATRILLYEPDEASFLYCCCINDVSDIINNDSVCIILYDENNENCLENALRREITPYNVDHIGTFLATGYESLYSETYNAILSIVKIIAENTVNDIANTLRFKEDTCLNELFSLSVGSSNYLIEDFMKNIPHKDIPVIIVAAGPSLKSNADKLKYAKNKALIIAVSHAARILHNKDVMPDFVAVSDPHPDADFMQHDTDRVNRLIISSAANRNNQADYNGKLYYHSFSKETFPYDFVQNMGDEISTGSVATDIFTIFLKSGFTSFILVGQDLAYGENGETHATGIEKKDNPGSEVYVKGINKSYVKTRQDWLGFKSYYEDQIMAHPEITVIDATEGGAYIEGSDCMTLEQAIDTFCLNEYDITNWFHNIPHAITTEESKNIKKDLLSYTDKIKHFTEISDKEIELNLKIQGVMLGIYERDDKFSSYCTSYDNLYHELFDDQTSPLIFRYMSESLARYNRNAMVYEQTQDIFGRLKEELELFKAFQEKLPKLTAYITSLMTES